MLKITAFNGSARKDGNTAILLKAALAEMEKKGFETELVQLAGRPLRGCTACNGCFKSKDKKCAQPDDGLLEVIVLETRTRLRLIAKLGTVYKGTHLREPGVSHFSCRSLELTPLQAAPTGRQLFPLDVDGDPLGDVPLAVSVVPGALRVRAPGR